MSEVIFKPEGLPAEVLLRVLQASGALLASERVTALGLPDDELHREILLPLLPAMLGDEALREFWLGQGTRGFLARLGAYAEGSGSVPRWESGDFEIHVTASYSAGADARALADTLLSEDALREVTAELMNRVLETVWAELPRVVQVPASLGTADAEVEELVQEETGEVVPGSVDLAVPSADPGFADGLVEELQVGAATIESGRPYVTWRQWSRWPRWKKVMWWKKWGGGDIPARAYAQEFRAVLR